MVPINRLPDLCLIAIFRQMTLTDKIKARHVCFKWSQLVPYAVLTTRRLTIFWGSDITEEFERWINRRRIEHQLLLADGSPVYPIFRANPWNQLHFFSLTEDDVEQIIATLGGIKTLRIVINRIDSSQIFLLLRLLDRYRHQLTTLELFNDFADYPAAEVDRLYAAINSLSSLKYLQLKLLTMPLGDLSVISQLEVLIFITLNEVSTSDFAAMLRKYAQASLRQIDFCNVLLVDGKAETDVWEPLLGLSEHLRGCFHTLKLAYRPTDKPWLVCDYFRGLRSLSVAPLKMTFRQLFRHLSQLTELILLRLELDYASIIQPEKLADQVYLTKLPSVKGLIVSVIAMSSHQQLHQLNIPLSLPNLQVLHLDIRYFNKCTQCGLQQYSPTYLAANLELAKHCFRQIFRHLKANCSKLRRIEYNYQEILGSAEALLAE